MQKLFDFEKLEENISLFAFTASVGFSLVYSRLPIETKIVIGTYLSSFATSTAKKQGLALEPEFKPDLDRLFAHIGYDGPRKPTLEVLTTIQYLFLKRVPFETLLLHGYNANPNVLGKVNIDPAVIEAKILQDDRGGYCYELNQYFFYVMQALGFDCVTKTARVLWGYPEGARRPRTHIIILATIFGVRYIVDVAFGSSSSITPMLLDTEEPQVNAFDIHRVVQLQPPSYPPHHFAVQVLDDNGVHWLNKYIFDEDEISTPEDWIAQNWAVCTRPNTRMTDNILLCLVTPLGRYAMANNKLTFRKMLIDKSLDDVKDVLSSRKTVQVEERVITNREEYFQILKDHFNLDVPVEYQKKIIVPGAAWC